MESAQEESTISKTSHHHDLYFSDGNIILSAIHRRVLLFEKTPRPPTVECILFRVHKSVLAKSSRVFSDMLAIPDNPHDTVNPLYDGVPIVAMPDSAEEIGSLLACFYQPW